MFKRFLNLLWIPSFLINPLVLKAVKSLKEDPSSWTFTQSKAFYVKCSIFSRRAESYIRSYEEHWRRSVRKQELLHTYSKSKLVLKQDVDSFSWDIQFSKPVKFNMLDRFYLSLAVNEWHLTSSENLFAVPQVQKKLDPYEVAMMELEEEFPVTR